MLHYVNTNRKIQIKTIISISVKKKLKKNIGKKPQ
jgi:hypothetical protein